MPTQTTKPRETDDFQFANFLKHLELNSSATKYTCPFCFQSGFVESSFLDHVMELHEGDTTPVGCPICATRPGGNPK